jgi:esterase/lipase
MKRPKTSRRKAMPENALLEPLEYFVEASTKLAQAQEEASTAADKSYADAYRRYLDSMATLQEDVQKQWQEVGRSLSTGQSEIAQDVDAQRYQPALSANYMRAAKNIEDDYRDRCTTAYRTYLNELQSVQKETKKQFLDAYRAYLRAKQDAWTKLDVNAIADATAVMQYRNYL